MAKRTLSMRKIKEVLTEIRDNFMPKSKKMAIFEFGT